MSDILDWVTKRVGTPIRGVLHIGANLGQEAEDYSRLGLEVIWVEADPQLFALLRDNISSRDRQTAYLCLAAEEDGREVDFHIASNGGGSSSVLGFDTERFAREWPGVKEVTSVCLRTCRLDTLFTREGCDLSGVNLVVADVQGYELPVLRGLGRLLDGFDIIISEVNWAPVYQGATKPYQLEAFLLNRGFTRLWLGINDVQATGVWGRARTGPLMRLYNAVSIRLYYAAARCGVVRLMRLTGLLGLGRRFYCAVKRRTP